MTIRQLSLLLSLALCTSTISAQSILLVDPDGGGDFAAIDAAIEAASPGDTVLVKPGNYSAFPVIKKSLNLVVDGGGAEMNQVLVADLPPGSAVLLRGIFVRTSFGPGLSIENCQGSVWVQDSFFSGTPFILQSGDAVAVRDSRAVTMVDCTVTGGPGGLAGAAGAGMIVADSQLALYGCSVRGGDGARSEFGGDRDGAPGLVIQDSQVFAQDTFIGGGFGGAGVPVFGGACQDGGDGGHANVLMGDGTRLYLLSPNILAGDGGNSLPPCVSGVRGKSFEVIAGDVLPLANEGRAFDFDQVLRGGETGRLVVHAATGDFVWLGISFGHEPQRVPGIGSPLLLDLDLRLLFLGRVLVGDQLQRQLPIPELPAGLDALTLYLQPLLVGSGTAELGAGRSLTILDGRF